MSEHEGLRLMRGEMARQCGDALASMDAVRAAAHAVAASARATGRIVLYAMGGSHFVNRAVEPLYRELGLDVRAMAASEALMAPLPDAARTALIVSQSGRSGEIVELLEQPAGHEERFALTLEGDSPLAHAARASLVGAGGTELAFAATRSIIITLALHGAILEALGAPQSAVRQVLAADAPQDMSKVDAALASCDVVAFVGRHALQGAAQSAALSMMELARVPAIGFEGGQFRHGPYEFLRPGLGIVLMRSNGPDRNSIAAMAAASLEAGCTTVLLDAAGGEPVPGAIHVRFPPAAGLAAVVGFLLSLQHLNIAVALRRIPAGIGTPLRTSKVTV